MALPSWDAPMRVLPSQLYLGEATKDPIHLAVGRALSEWENIESISAVIFGRFVELRSAAAIRAYGVLTAGTIRREVLEAATWVFFRDKGGDPAMLDFVELFAAYGGSAQYINNIAHGICNSFIMTAPLGQFQTGWFLCPPHYNTRRRSFLDANAAYFYTAIDIDKCRRRFTQLSIEAADLDLYLRTNYPLP